jgi:bacterioferritin-associated ferredoxin
MYLCLCKGISDAEVRQAARAGHVTAEALIAVLGLRDEECCGNCVENIEEFLALARTVEEAEDADLPISIAS